MIVPRPRSEMRRIREVLRLHTELGSNLSAIATGARLARSTVRAYLARAAAAGLEAGAEAGLSDAALEAALFPPAPAVAGRAVPDWSAIDQELRCHKHVTRKLLWLEYKTTHPDGFEFSQFKLRLSEWQKASGRGLSMRQVHHAGETVTVQVDYAGDTVSVVEGGTAHAAQIFVACLPCSGLIYAEAKGAMADALTAQLRQPEIDAMPFSERLALLVDIQHSAMLTAALEQRLRRAGMRESACVENLDLRTPRGLDRSSIQALASGQ